jgi:hypothetical protein
MSAIDVKTVQVYRIAAYNDYILVFSNLTFNNISVWFIFNVYGILETSLTVQQPDQFQIPAILGGMCVGVDILAEAELRVCK